ncbi:Hypothetical predicted protein [Lecanosticta acicola]|uniref:CID domain-containing protein n=1 Tax=Lecanosticta acicola TaxID=111012 RepID=A0AAI8YSQ8_9PEZI|nr:Hypothetical predicted protein [Lecanosticta acicola]
MDQYYTPEYSQLDQPLEVYLSAVGDATSRAEARKLARLINTTCNTCTTQNVQYCKNSIINDVLPSAPKTVATFDYMTALGRKSAPRSADGSNIANALGHESADEGQIAGEPLPAYRRLHILYVVHDVLETLLEMDRTKRVPTHLRLLDFNALIATVKAHIFRLFRVAACRGHVSGDEVGEELLRLVQHWAGGVFNSEEVETLRNLVNSIPNRSWDTVLEELNAEEARRTEEDKGAREEKYKWTIPYRHGVKDDPDAPWHELPAANGLYMKSTRGYPLRAGAFPKGGYQLKNGGQEADEELKKDINWLHKEMLHCFDDHTNADEVQDIDALGNKIWKDPERPTRNYWGFTYDGIEKTRENSRKFRQNATGYDDIASLRQDRLDDVDSAVARARALASGRGGFDYRDGYDSYGGLGRGRGRGARGGWRGPPRGGGGGFRGSRGGGGGGGGGRYY